MYVLGENSFELVSGMPLLNWVEYNAAIGNWDVKIHRDAATSSAAGSQRKRFRFGMDGPNAGAIFNELVEGGAPEIKFFRTAQVKIAGCDVMALRHGMAGHQGVELSGSYENQAKVLEAILKVGAKHGLKRGGTLAYFSTIAESSWVAAPLPAIYTSPELKAYREWLPSKTWEAVAQIGGSFVSDNIEDYYLTPYDLGAQKNIKFDHDFIGREALEAMAKEPQRVRRTLIWNPEDVARIQRSLVEPGLAFKLMRLPVSTYSYQQNDAIRTNDGELIGTSAFSGYTANENAFVSLGRIKPEHAELGTELVLIWGEPNGGSRKPHVERHHQTEVRVTVAPAPFAAKVQEIKYGTV